MLRGEEMPAEVAEQVQRGEVGAVLLAGLGGVAHFDMDSADVAKNLR